MGVFHVFQIVQMVPNRTTHHKYDFLKIRTKGFLTVKQTNLKIKSSKFRKIYKIGPFQ